MPLSSKIAKVLLGCWTIIKNQFTFCVDYSHANKGYSEVTASFFPCKFINYSIWTTFLDPNVALNKQNPLPFAAKQFVEPTVSLLSWCTIKVQGGQLSWTLKLTPYQNMHSLHTLRQIFIRPREIKFLFAANLYLISTPLFCDVLSSYFYLWGPGLLNYGVNTTYDLISKECSQILKFGRMQERNNWFHAITVWIFWISRCGVAFEARQISVLISHRDNIFYDKMNYLYFTFT